MVETIAPVVYGSRNRYWIALLLHATMATVSAAMFGAAAGSLGAAFGAPWGRAGAMAVVAIAVLYLAREAGGLPIPIFDRKRQVPDWWRTFYAPEIAAALYGAGLGIGFLTFLGHGTFVVVTALAVWTGDPITGALLTASFGLTRGLSLLVVAWTRDEEGPLRLISRLSDIGSGSWRKAVNAIACAGIAAALLTSCSQPPSFTYNRPSPSPEQSAAFAERPRARKIGTVEHNALLEVSGLAASRVHEDILWTHNDSGGGPLIYCMTTVGDACGVFEVPGAAAADWEDIAIGPHPGSNRDHIYIGDIGDNRKARRSVTVYVIPEPDPSSPGVTDAPIVHRLSYPNGPRDAEALLVSPRGDVYIVAKELGRAPLFRARAPLDSRERLERVANIDLPSSLVGVTGGALSPDGERAVLATYLGVFELHAADRGSRWWTGAIARLRMGRFRQLEAVAYGADATTVYAIGEGRHPAIKAIMGLD